MKSTSIVPFALLAACFALSSRPAHARGRAQDEEQKSPAENAPSKTESPETAAPVAPAPNAVPTAPAAEAALKTERPENPTQPAPAAFSLQPYVAIAGGLKVDNVIDKEGEDRDDRFVTFAVARFGILGKWGIATVQSELMANGGIGLHGTSAYEGQAALQVRQQLVRLTYEPWMVEVGRVVDEASVDFISAHVQDTLVQDTATRDPLLYSGYNLGNGIRGTVELVKGLRLGLALNAGNPVSTTSTLAVGGTFPPFERIYTQAYQAVNQGPNHFPDDTFHAIVVTPSVLYGSEYGDVKVAVQGFDIDTNTGKGGDDQVRGYNLRGTGRLKIAHGLVVPFASAAYTRNDTLEPNNLERRSPDRYQAVNLGGGIDFNVARRYAENRDAADGVGLQYQQVQFQVGDGLVTTLRYANLGGTYWLTPHVAVDGRASLWVQQQKGAKDFGERNFIVGLRAVMP